LTSGTYALLEFSKVLIDILHILTFYIIVNYMCSDISTTKKQLTQCLNIKYFLFNND